MPNQDSTDSVTPEVNAGAAPAQEGGMPSSNENKSTPDGGDVGPVDSDDASDYHTASEGEGSDIEDDGNDGPAGPSPMLTPNDSLSVLCDAMTMLERVKNEGLTAFEADDESVDQDLDVSLQEAQEAYEENFAQMLADLEEESTNLNNNSKKTKKIKNKKKVKDCSGLGRLMQRNVTAKAD
eukprot:gene28945-3667_t